MAASWSIVPVTPTQNQKRWVMQCNGVLTFPSHECLGPLGVSTPTGDPIFTTRAALLEAALTNNWRQPVDVDPGVTDYCPNVPTE